MKLFIKTMCFHFICIIFFGIIYLYLHQNFGTTNHADQKIIDFLLLSTTIQSGVGISNIYPTHYYGKLTMIIQQITMISSHVFTIYLFTI